MNSVASRVGRIATASALAAACVFSAVSSESADAATCYTMASFGLKACGTWNANVISYNSQSYAQTSNFTWTITRLDSTIRINWIHVREGANSRCYSDSYPGCSTFAVSGKDYALPGTGTHSVGPAWGNKWGHISGFAQYQMSSVLINWCHGSNCTTSQTGNVGGGSAY